MTRHYERTQFADLEAEDKPPFTFPPAGRPVRAPDKAPWLMVFLIVVTITAGFAFLYLNYGQHLRALLP